MKVSYDTYLVHYSPLIERYDFITKQFLNHGLDFTLCDSEPPTDWMIDNPAMRREKMLFLGETHDAESIRRCDASVIWKHLQAFESVVRRNTAGLVLEDDVFLHNNFINILNDALEDMKESWDIIYLGSGCNLRLPGKGLIRKSHPASKCADSYIVTPSAARKFHYSMMNSHLPIDWEMSYQMKYHDMKVFWLEPPIVIQGSQNGTWTSALNGKRENLYK